MRRHLGILFVLVLGHYSGVNTHTLDIEIWNYTTSAWDPLGSFFSRISQASKLLPVLEDTDYISSGAAQVRINHPQSGNASHHAYIDYIALLY